MEHIPGSQGIPHLYGKSRNLKKAFFSYPAASLFSKGKHHYLWPLFLEFFTIFLLSLSLFKKLFIDKLRAYKNILEPV